MLLALLAVCMSRAWQSSARWLRLRFHALAMRRAAATAIVGNELFDSLPIFLAQVQEIMLAFGAQHLLIATSSARGACKRRTTVRYDVWVFGRGLRCHAGAA